MGCRVKQAIVRAQEPHHLREAVKIAGINLDDGMVELFIERANHLLQKSVSLVTRECLEEFIEVMEREMPRRNQIKLCFIALLTQRIEKRTVEIAQEEDDEYFTSDDHLLMLQKRGYLLQDVQLKPGMNLMFAVEKETIITTLEKCDFNRTLTAKVLGISIRTLRNKINFFLGRFALYEEYMDSKRHLQ